MAHGAEGGNESSTEATASSESAPNQTYRLFPGDLIAFRVFKQDDLAMDLRIPASGGTTMPLIGDIDTLAGRTLLSVQKMKFGIA